MMGPPRSRIGPPLVRQFWTASVRDSALFPVPSWAVVPVDRRWTTPSLGSIHERRGRFGLPRSVGVEGGAVSVTLTRLRFARADRVGGRWGS